MYAFQVEGQKEQKGHPQEGPKRQTRCELEKDHTLKNDKKHEQKGQGH